MADEEGDVPFMVSQHRTAPSAPPMEQPQPLPAYPQSPSPVWSGVTPQPPYYTTPPQEQSAYEPFQPQPPPYYPYQQQQVQPYQPQPQQPQQQPQQQPTPVAGASWHAPAWQSAAGTVQQPSMQQYDALYPRISASAERKAISESTDTASGAGSAYSLASTAVNWVGQYLHPAQQAHGAPSAPPAASAPYYATAPPSIETHDRVATAYDPTLLAFTYQPLSPPSMTAQESASLQHYPQHHPAVFDANTPLSQSSELQVRRLEQESPATQAPDDALLQHWGATTTTSATTDDECRRRPQVAYSQEVAHVLQSACRNRQVLGAEVADDAFCCSVPPSDPLALPLFDHLAYPCLPLCGVYSDDYSPARIVGLVQLTGHVARSFFRLCDKSMAAVTAQDNLVQAPALIKWLLFLEEVPEIDAEWDTTVAFVFQQRPAFAPCQHFTCERTNELNLMYHFWLYHDIQYGGPELAQRIDVAVVPVASVAPVHLEQSHELAGAPFNVLGSRAVIIHSFALSPNNLQLQMDLESDAPCAVFWSLGIDRHAMRIVATLHVVALTHAGEAELTTQLSASTALGTLVEQLQQRGGSYALAAHEIKASLAYAIDVPKPAAARAPEAW